MADWCSYEKRVHLLVHNFSFVDFFFFCLFLLGWDPSNPTSCLFFLLLLTSSTSEYKSPLPDV